MKSRSVSKHDLTVNIKSKIIKLYRKGWSVEQILTEVRPIDEDQIYEVIEEYSEQWT